VSEAREPVAPVRRHGRLRMGAEQLVPRRAPQPPGRLRVGRRAHLRVQPEDAPLPVEQVELVHGPSLPDPRRPSGVGNNPAFSDEGGTGSMSSKSARLAGVVAVVCAAACGLPGAFAYTKPGTIRITDVEKQHSYVDTGPHGRSPGDVDVYRSLLYNRRITTKALGHADMVCTTISSTA